MSTFEVSFRKKTDCMVKELASKRTNIHKLFHFLFGWRCRNSRSRFSVRQQVL